MAWTTISKPNGGDTTEKSLIDAIIDNLMHLFGLSGAATLAAGANGSFENDTDADGTPDSWAFAALPNGTGAIYNHIVDPAGSDWSAHGKNSFRFVRSAGVGNGGGTLTSDDYFECGPQKALTVNWQMKCSAAGVRVKVEILWYTRALVAISTSTVYTSVSNPTSWTLKTGTVNAPATAKYAKLKITGGDTTPDVAASIYFDDVSIVPNAPRTPRAQYFTSNGSFTPDAGITQIRVRVHGGGGGGAAGAGGSGGSGGGGGGYAEAVLTTAVPGTPYAVTVGVGGSGGISGGAAATAGGTSSIGALISVTGGGAGTTGGAGGAGGAGAGDVPVNGQAGEASSGASGGGGGISGSGAPPGRNTPTNGRLGGGGGGGGANGSNGGAGGDGLVVIEW